MEVFVVPVASDRYELYCEPAAEAHEEAGPPTGRIARIRARFSEVLKAAEQRQHQRHAGGQEERGVISRLQDRMLGWVVERIAEQRLLWNLRRQTAAVAAHPQDMSFEQVTTLIRRTLQRDYERHRRWLIVDALLLVATGVLAIVPGPNVLAYYFAFRVWGHWLSMRGARQGLDRITWTGRPCPPLSELREAVALEPSVRQARIRDIALQLRLQHLTTFFERIAVRHA